MTNQTKAQLQAENEVLKAQINELQNILSEDKVSENKKTERKFNIFENTYKQIVRGYLNSNKSNEFTFKVRHYSDAEFEGDNGTVKIEGAQKVLYYLNKQGALKVLKITQVIEETGKKMFEVKIKDFNIRTKVPGKFGDYFVFKKPYESVTSQEMFKDQA